MAKARILNSTLDLYVAGGGSSISITAEPEAAGAAPGLVVHHYGSKEGLRRAVDRL
jgi:TetR/AcrR family transcriptional regulator, regulator of cefoperazone and chloramphenicol sensitivity